jgi:hypothetical protein
VFVVFLCLIAGSHWRTAFAVALVDAVIEVRIEQASK